MEIRDTPVFSVPRFSYQSTFNFSGVSRNSDGRSHSENTQLCNTVFDDNFYIWNAYMIFFGELDLCCIIHDGGPWRYAPVCSCWLSSMRAMMCSFYHGSSPAGLTVDINGESSWARNASFSNSASSSSFDLIFSYQRQYKFKEKKNL